MVATAIIGGAVVGAGASIYASNKGASAEEKASNLASQTQLGMFGQTRADQTPWRQAGGQAVQQLGSLTGPGGQFEQPFTQADFQSDPGYKFRLDQAEQAIQRSAAARGGLVSGGTLRSLDQYTQGLASQDYQGAFDRFQTDRGNRFNMLASLAGLGQTSVAQTGAQGTQVAGQVGQNLIGAGNAAAAGYVGAGNAINGAVGSGLNTWMQYNYLNQLTNPHLGMYNVDSAPETSMIGGDYSTMLPTS